MGTLASVSVLFYRLFRYRVHEATAQIAGAATSQSQGSSEASKRSFIRRAFPVIYGNVVPPTGTVLPVVTVMAVLGLMDYFVWIYGIGVAAVVATVALVQLLRVTARASAR